jgi:GT2 family glycosyltransferase
MKFAAFIMTYERPDILPDTISKILAQTVAPEKILIVDNSASRDTEQLIAAMADPRLQYHRVGYNSGPAGAAYIGLSTLKEQDYDWIYWGDDDDPPRFPDCFEVLLQQAGPRIGAIGAVGSLFDWRSGNRKRYRDHELVGLLPVDTIGGNMCMLVNARAVSEETLPNPDLFFGIEEFEFHQKLIRAGWRVCVLGELLYRYRVSGNKLGVEKRASLISRAKFSSLHREYYSYRNGIYLMAHEYKKYKLAGIYILRALVKIPFGYARGIRFGLKNSKMLLAAISHGLGKKMGKVY